MFAVACKRIATVAAKQEARAFSMLAGSFKSAAPTCQQCIHSSKNCNLHGHVCGVSCGCKARKTMTARYMYTGHDISTPSKVLETLEEGNNRFVKGEIMAPNRNMERVKELQGGQAPFAAFLSCADSRVPVEIVFDQGFGDVFICRIAGNIVNTETIGSLEFGTAVLGAKVLYVLGHSSCGAVKATMAGAAVPGVISSLYYRIKPACDHAHGDLDKAIEENVKLQVNQLAVSPVLKELVEQGKLEIVGGVYDLVTGKVNRVC
mmetsp:Transcript_13264/g.25434  ORF Transcript_13264/g.25434 Transcript_13264/m.25434 type:complete len:262 (+) Transcript_13264:72-857(+)|eukprot:scaffold13448_cov180-Amphora_coffeaeformis.AAC.5